MGDNGSMVLFEKFHIKTRGITLSEKEADDCGIRGIYNYTSDLDFMDQDGIVKWISGLHSKDDGESVLVERAMKFVEGVPLYVCSCIVFRSDEMCNVFYLKNQGSYDVTNGFYHLFN